MVFLISKDRGFGVDFCYPISIKENGVFDTVCLKELLQFCCDGITTIAIDIVSVTALRI